MENSSLLARLDRAAEIYVKLVLSVGHHDADYVDAYYGPPRLKAEADAANMPLAAIKVQATTLLAEVQSLDASASAEMTRLRHHYLRRQLESLISRVNMLEGARFTFDEESLALYDAVAPTLPESHFQNTLQELSSILPGSGPVPDRYDAFKRQFVIPREALDEVFGAAIAEGRERTRKHISLPENESFKVEYVTGKSWSGYNWYKGESRSLIQVNTDLPIYIDRAVDLGCHEGYPGHHVYNTLLEQHLVRERGWIEFSVYALFSPQSLVAEGTANYGIDVAFPGDERLAFEREVLFPLAGLDPSKAAMYQSVHALFQKLNYAGNEAARRYLNGAIDRDEAARWLAGYALMGNDRALQRTRFFDQYRSYVINYNLGQDIVRAYVEGRGGTPDNPGKRWQVFRDLLSKPQLPASMRG